MSRYQNFLAERGEDGVENGGSAEEFLLQDCVVGFLDFSTELPVVWTICLLEVGAAVGVGVGIGSATIALESGRVTAG
jgi:hypothetical protein